TDLAHGASDAQSYSFRLPEGLAGSGTFRFVITTDVFGVVREFDAQGVSAENNNQATTERVSTLIPAADLAVSGVTAPEQLIGDPVPITVGWTVSNLGGGPGLTDHWVDAVVVSADAVLSADDRVVARFDH